MATVELPAAVQQINITDQNKNIVDDPLTDIAVWQLIWPFMSSEDKSTLRLVSRPFKNLCDTLGVNIILDNKSFQLPLGFPPPASHLILQDLVLVPADNIDFIQNLHLVKSILMDGAITFETWTEILFQCQMVEKLDVSPGFTTETMALLDGESPVILPSLKELLFPNLFRKNRYQQNISWKIIENFLICYQMPKLEKLLIRLFFKCQTDFVSSVEAIEKFLQGHSKSLKHLELILRKSTACCHPHELDFPEEHKLPQSEAEVGDFVNLKLKSFIANCDTPAHEVLDKILRDQDTLENIEYDKVWAPWEFYMPIIQQNQDSLRIVKLRYAVPIIDLSAFAECSYLQKLKLGTDHQMSRNEVNMINFSRLPTSLIFLQIEKYTVESSDLASVGNLINLHTLELEFLSNTECENTGITAEVVKGILRLPKLQVIYLEEFEKPHTSLLSIDPDIRAVNMIKGDYITQRLGCRRYGVAVAPPEIFQKWYSRTKNYNSHRLVLC